MKDVCSESHFQERVANHVLTIVRDDGLYRHLRCAKPGTGVDGFDLITWPGYLCYCGDMGEYVFQRCDDMLAFFRRKDSGINPSYWSEKVVAQDRDGVKKYDADKFRRVIAEILDEHEASEGLRQAVNDEVLSAADDGEYAAWTAVDEFCHIEDDEYGKPQGFRFHDFHECDLTEYTFRFIFCCRAIVWAVQRYDEQKGRLA